MIYACALKAGLSDAEAQEVVQETVLVVARKVGDYNSDPALGSFKNWLLVITRRRIVDQFRKRPRHVRPWQRHSDDTGTATVERIPDPASSNWERGWEEEWQQNLLEVAMDRVKQTVSPRQWLLFHQNAIKQLPPAEVAEKYGVSLAQVYVAKYRISSLVKKELRKLQKKIG